MNKDTKEYVYKLLLTDERAREDDWYLVEKIACQMTNLHNYTPFTKVIEQMKKKRD